MEGHGYRKAIDSRVSVSDREFLQLRAKDVEGVAK